CLPSSALLHCGGTTVTSSRRRGSGRIRWIALARNPSGTCISGFEGHQIGSRLHDRARKSTRALAIPWSPLRDEALDRSTCLIRNAATVSSPLPQPSGRAPLHPAELHPSEGDALPLKRLPERVRSPLTGPSP